MSGNSSPAALDGSFDDSTNDSTLSTDDGEALVYDAGSSSATEQPGSALKQSRKKKLPKDPEAPKRPQRLVYSLQNTYSICR